MPLPLAYGHLSHQVVHGSRSRRQAKSQKPEIGIQTKHEGHNGNGVSQKSMHKQKKSQKDTDSKERSMIKGPTMSNRKTSKSSRLAQNKVLICPNRVTHTEAESADRT